jgi:hypothetical protein
MKLQKTKIGHLAKNIEIGIAKTQEEKLEIYRLRYHIYTKEVYYNFTIIDHIKKLLYDNLDEWGTTFYAKVDSKIVGTVRANIGHIENFPQDIAEMYLMNRFKKFYNSNDYTFGFASKGMVAPGYREFPIFTQLMSKVFELFCQSQVNFAFGSSNFYLLPLHEHYGHQRIGKNVADPNFGVLSGFVIMPDNIHHLQDVHSPFLPIATQYRKHNYKIVDWFSREFPETQNIVNSQLITEEDYWKILTKHLDALPNERISILHQTTALEAKKLLHACSTIVQCSAGDYIATQGYNCQELFILLSGSLYSPNLPNLSKITPGQPFGRNGLLKRCRHHSNILAKTNTEILVLSYHFFLKYRRLFPEITNKIINNLNEVPLLSPSSSPLAAKFPEPY